MDVTCQKCNAKLEVPDEKLPQGQQAVISCPRCSNKQIVDIRHSGKGAAIQEGNQMTAPPRTEEGYDFGMLEEGLGRDIAGGRTKLALVMESDLQQVDLLRQSIEELGYRYVSAENSQAALNKMRLHHFDLVVLFDRFDGVELHQSPILAYMNHLPLSVRRTMFLALIGDNFRTMDHLTAFIMSANAVINGRDVERLTPVLDHAISDNEMFYKVFMDTLAEVGKG
jgi:hypothetical protein